MLHIAQGSARQHVVICSEWVLADNCYAILLQNNRVAIPLVYWIEPTRVLTCYTHCLLYNLLYTLVTCYNR